MPFTKPVVVIDNGSYNIKAGFACDNHPVSIFRTVVGRPKYLNGTYGRTLYEVFIGDDAVARMDELDLCYPVSRGKITHWDNMERVWHHIFYRELKAAPEDRAVMLSCAPQTDMKDKAKCCEIFFESLNAPALCVKPQSVLALYGSGKTTGLSVDLGRVITEINPVYEGGSITYANMETNLAGCEIIKFIKDCFDKRRLELGKEPDKTLSEMLKQVYVTKHGAIPIKEYKKTYTLPSGEVIDVSDELYMSGEIYFQPDLVLGKRTKYLALQDAIVTGVLKIDTGLQSEMYDTIVIHGGMSVIKGLSKRLILELENVIHRPVNIIESTEVHSVAWLGGAVFAGITEARKLWVTKQQFEDQGARIVRNRFY